MRILITGGSGLLGSNLGYQLTKNITNAVFLLVRSEPVQPKPGVEYIKGDILDFPHLAQIIREHAIDTIIHTAAIVSFSGRDRFRLFETNVTGTANVVNASLQEKAGRLIHISSVAAIGKPENVLDAREPVTITEDFKWTETPLNSNYAKSKYLAELEVWRGQAEGLSTVIVNPSVILGAGDLTRSSTQLFNYVYKGNPFLTGGSINYIDLNDLIEVIELLLENKDIEDERFIVSGGAVTYEQFFRTIAETIGGKAPSLKLGRYAIEVLWRLEGLRAFLTASSPLITRETSISARSNIYFDSSRLKSRSGFHFTPLNQTVSRVCAELGLAPASQ